MLRVIGAGFGRTGTYSVKIALEQLGFGPCYHMREIFEYPDHVPVWQSAGEGRTVDWDALFAGFTSAVDWPVSAFYEELIETYPQSKVILTVRNPEQWHESGRNTIFPQRAWAPEDNVPADMLAHGHMVDTVIWQGIFDGRVLDRDHAIAVFNRHIQDVRERVPAGRLLMYDVKQGWEPLCAFLDVPVPSGEPFPRLNDTEELRKRRAARLESRGIPLSVSRGMQEE